MKAIAMGLAVLCVGVLEPAASAAQDAEEQVARAIQELRAEYDARIEALEAEVARLRGTAPEGAHPGAEFTDPPLLSLRGFADIDYDALRASPRPGFEGFDRDTTNHFTLGDLDLFITSQIDRDLSFLAETLFEFRQDGQTFVDVERLLLKYDVADWLNVSAGRGHTGIGYWNQRFHHGAWLQTTTERPILFRFEDDDGVLPVHFVGLELGGTFDLGAATLSYTANLANGRARESEEIQLVKDENSSKMTSLKLQLNPSGTEDAGLGVSVAFDRIPAAPAISTARANSINELIFGGFVFYEVYPFELLAELQFIRHDDHTSGQMFQHSGGYVQLARSFGLWKPYYRYDFLSLESGDPYYFDFFDGVAKAESTTAHLVGVRWDAWSYLALKAELYYSRATSVRQRGIRLQSSFAF